MNAFRQSQRIGNRAFFHGVRSPIRTRMVHDRMHAHSQEIIDTLMAQQAECGWIAESAHSLAIDSENGFGGGVQKQPDASLAFMQSFLGALAVRDFLLQFES